MTVMEALGQYLRDEATATRAAVGSRSYWVYAPTNATLPYIQFRLQSSRRMAIATADVHAPEESVIELVCLASSQAAAWAVADAVLTDLDGLAQVIPTGGSVRIKRCYCADKSDLLSEAALEEGIFAVSLSFQIVS